MTSPGKGSQEFLNTLKAMEELHLRKSAGYGTAEDPWANFRQSEKFGIPAHIGVLIRMSDKWERIQNLINNPKAEQVGESLADSMADLSAYGIIFNILYREYLTKVKSLNGIYPDR